MNPSTAVEECTIDVPEFKRLSSAIVITFKRKAFYLLTITNPAIY